MLGGPEFDSLTSVKYLFLRELLEPRDNSLRLVVEEAIDNWSAAPYTKSSDPGVARILTEAWPIESVKGCKRFDLFWTQYVAYLVTEELVGSAGSYDDEVYKGRLLRVYTKSHFLDYLSLNTGGHTDPVLHYKLICLDHLIDIASYAPPDIRVTDSASASASPPPIQ
jgi:hypothetical protein